jgi:hypothetical protein
MGMMKAILKCSGRIVEVEQIEGDPDHMIVFGMVFRRTMRDAMGYRPVHLVPKDKLEIIEEDTEQDGGK